ncbi:MAG: pseudouridine synthase [Candidatus Lokiarchaeota archaeon]|nr:pseudouridine synthase [Candidatus Lokiarchaeota archaeon]
MPLPTDRLDLDINKSKSRILKKILSILHFQFGTDIFNGILTESRIDIDFSRNTGNIKYIYLDSERIFSYKPTVGLFSLSIEGARLLHTHTTSPHHRVIIQTEVEEFIREGKSVFAQHIVGIDETLRIGSEVLIVNEYDQLIAIGKLNVPPTYVGLSVGQAVNVRKGIPKIT